MVGEPSDRQVRSPAQQTRQTRRPCGLQAEAVGWGRGGGGMNGLNRVRSRCRYVPALLLVTFLTHIHVSFKWEPFRVVFALVWGALHRMVSSRCFRVHWCSRTVSCLLILRYMYLHAFQLHPTRSFCTTVPLCWLPVDNTYSILRKHHQRRVARA